MEKKRRKEKSKGKKLNFLKLRKVKIVVLVVLFIVSINLLSVNGDIGYTFKNFEILYNGHLIEIKPISPLIFNIVNYSDKINISEIKVQYIIFNKTDSTQSSLILDEINRTLKITGNTIIFDEFGLPYNINLYYNNSLIYSAAIETEPYRGGTAGFFSYAFIIGILALPFLVIMGIVLLLIYFRKKKRKKFKKKNLFLLLLIVFLCSVRFSLAIIDPNPNNNQNITTVDVVDTGNFTKEKQK